MKVVKYHWFVVLFICGCLFLEAETQPKICLNMIVKDEAGVIERCLESVLPMIDYLVIVDTGSTDGTQEKIKTFMKRRGVEGELYQRPWVNFGQNRNEALELAKGKGDYLFFIDADEYLVFDKEFIRPSLTKDYYYITILHSNTQYGRIQLAKSSLNWSWEGVLHEYLCCREAGSFATLNGIKTIYTYEGARSKDPDKYKKDAATLERALLQDPDNHRYRFYLAQSYRDALDYEKALDSYQKRVRLGGWDQEMFYSLLQIAAIKELLNYDSEECIESYLQAFLYRPSRSEPLYRMVNLFRRKREFEKGYKLAEIASTISRPSDVLFVEDWVYDYGIDLERSICAYWMGNYQECQDICLQILGKSDLPESVRDCVTRNLEFSNSRLAELVVRGSDLIEKN